MSSLKDRSESPRRETPKRDVADRIDFMMTIAIGLAFCTVPLGIGLALYTDHSAWLALSLVGFLLVLA